MKVRIAVAPAGAIAGDAGPASFVALIDALERHGADTIWLSDVPLGPGIDPIVGLGVAASRTRRLKLGANVVPFGRHPFHLAKQLAQLDRVSAGRVLLTFVPGLGAPDERAVLGVADRDRGAALEDVIVRLRRWWAGDTLAATDAADAVAVPLPVRPVQDPLEIWLGGNGPKALRRAGRLADGWLGAGVTVGEAIAAKAAIEAAALDAGRVVDPEHFGLSIPYARSADAGDTVDAARTRLRARRPDLDAVDELLPVGADALERLLSSLIAGGITKFVLRPVAPVTSWDDELVWLAAHVFALQT